MQVYNKLTGGVKEDMVSMIRNKMLTEKANAKQKKDDSQKVSIIANDLHLLLSSGDEKPPPGEGDSGDDSSDDSDDENEDADEAHSVVVDPSHVPMMETVQVEPV